MQSNTGRVLVICPTRNRPGNFASLVASVERTSTRADLVAYIDDDDPKDYSAVRSERLAVVRGPRIGSVASINAIANANPGYSAYGMVPDDAELVVAGWDEYVLETIAGFKNRVGVVSPHHNLGHHVDMPFVSSEWLAAVGWLAYPENYHWVWPIIVGFLGEMTQLVHAPETRFSIYHNPVQCGSPHQMNDADCREFFYWMVLENTPDRFPQVIKRIRAAMA